MKIESYKVKGQTKYRFRAFLGRDPVTGKQNRVFRGGFDTRKEAELAYLRLETDAHIARGSDVRFAAVYDRWMDTYQLGVKESTRQHVSQIVRDHIMPVFGRMRMSDITPPAVQEWINQQIASAPTARKRIMYLKKIFDYARKQRLIDENPIDLVEIPRKKKQPREEENFYTLQELQQFFDLAKERLSPMWFTFFRLLAYTGMRRGEALALTWDDVDLSVPEISVSKTVSRGDTGHIVSDTPKTDRSNRVILIDQETADLIDSLDRNGQFVFANTKGSFITPSQPVRQLHRVVDGTGLKYISPHGFRHTHCSMLFSAGVSIPEVQDRMGHADVKTTIDIYNHVCGQDRETALNRFIKYVSANPVPVDDEKR